MKRIFEFSKKSYSQNKADDKNKKVQSSTIAVSQSTYLRHLYRIMRFAVRKKYILILEKPQRKLNS